MRNSLLSDVEVDKKLENSRNKTDLLMINVKNGPVCAIEG